MRGKQSGFTIIELLVTLIVAALFIIASFQLYTVVLRTDGQTRAQTIAQNTAQDYLERYRASVPSPCAASTPLTNSPVTVTGLVNVQISVNVSCPKSSSGSLANLSKIDVTLSYNHPTTTLSYSAWSYAPDVCGAGWILVPGDSRFDTPNFCVMKYEAKNVNGQAISQAAGTPWVNINQNDAIAASAATCPTCHLVSEPEWMTIAANVLNVPSNWSGGAVGSGAMYVGHTDNNPASALAASSDDTNGYYGTGNTSGNQRRTLTLNNGEVVWDLSGNVWEWTNKVLGASEQPGLSGESSNAWKEWNNGSMLWNNFPTTSLPSAISSQVASWTSAQSIGTICSNYGSTTNAGYLRGSSYMDTVASYDGVLSLYLCGGPSFTNPNVGFRVAKSINSLPEQLVAPSSCPTGFIPVPGDARFGTAGFCVMKYEAKNDGSGNAVSVAAGTPWVNISQTNALTESRTVCAGCHLITDSEWMTLAANIINNPSNWTGGVVGSGSLYRGHTDDNPAGILAASTDDTNGYYGTGNSATSGADQRRTFVLSNGQVIWDLSGNVWELTSGTMDSAKQPGLSGESSYSWKEWNNPNMFWNGMMVTSRPVAMFSSPSAYWGSSQGYGMMISDSTDTSTTIMFRGGGYGEASVLDSGVLALNFWGTAGATNSGIGFRVAK